MMVATPKKCEQKFQSMISELNKRIEKWERSRQGDGGEQTFEDYDNKDGKSQTEDRDQGALDKIHAFFEYNQLYLIYLWYMVESHGLLGSSLQRLSEDIGATNGSFGVPSVFEIDVDGEEERSTASTNGGQSTGLDSSISGLGKFGLKAAIIEAKQHERNRLARLQTASIDADQQEKNRLHERAENLRNRINSLKREKRKLGLERVETEPPEKKAKLDFLTHEIDDITVDIKQKQEELESILCTPTRNNRTPESAKK
jgi:hypothetical protein